MTQSEKRKHARVSVDDEICVRDVDSGQELGVLANVHEDGFMIISDGGLQEDKLYQVVFELEEGGKVEKLALGADCLWISETGTGDQVWAGFQITRLSDAARVRLQQLVSRYED